MGIDNIFSRSFWNKWDFFFSNFKYATFSIPDSGHEHIAHFIYFNFLSLSDLKIQNIPRLSHLSISSSINESKELFWKSRNILFFADVRWSKWIFIADTDVVAIVVRQDFFFFLQKIHIIANCNIIILVIRGLDKKERLYCYCLRSWLNFYNFENSNEQFRIYSTSHLEKFR